MFNHSSRKVLSATTPSSGFTAAANGCDGGAPAAPTASECDHNLNRNAVGRLRHNRHRDDDDGNPGSSVSFGMSKAGDNGSGGGGGGGEFGLTTEDAEEEYRANSFPVRRERHTASAPHNKKQQPPQQHRRGGRGSAVSSGAVSSGRSFYDPCEIAFRSRRLFDAYSGSESGEGGGDNESPRRVDNNTRSTKVILFSMAQWLRQTRYSSVRPPPPPPPPELCSQGFDSFILFV